MYRNFICFVGFGFWVDKGCLSCDVWGVVLNIGNDDKWVVDNSWLGFCKNSKNNFICF